MTKFAISRFTTADLTNERADAVLAEGMNLLATVDGPDDVSCVIVMARDGPVTAFSVGSGTIFGADDYAQVCGVTGRIHIVNQINWCGGLISPNIIGCSDTPGGCMILSRITELEIEAVLWVHEFGHNQGLGHRNDRYAVMNPVVDAENRRVNQAECTAYGTTISALGTRFLQPTVNSMDVKSFVKQIFIHGVPYENARRYRHHGAAVLLPMLRDSTNERYWSNIVITLGMMGDPVATQHLIGFILQGSGLISKSAFDAKSSAIISLGYLVNEPPIPENSSEDSASKNTAFAFDFLVQGLRLETWLDRAKWRAPYYDSQESQAHDLVKATILGLALTGKHEAATALVAARQGIESTPRELPLVPLIESAMKTLTFVAENGLREYYRRGNGPSIELT